MSVGLLALLDDVAGIAKAAAASLDDVAGQAAKAGAKAAGAVIDDAAVTPRYVEGLSADRELPIVGKIALGSIRNKLLFLLPAALILSVFASWLITPLLMLGGAYLCYEGAEKIYQALFPHAAHAHEESLPKAASAEQLESIKVAGAVKTDFILSAEIMTIALAATESPDLITRALILAIVAIGITVAVYGGVALILRADDAGLALAKHGYTNAGRSFGRWLVRIMPSFMNGLNIVGTAAMIWVGGGIIVHGLASFNFTGPEHLIEQIASLVAGVPPIAQAAVHWLAIALGNGIVGILFGLLLIPFVSYVLSPIWKTLRPGSAH
ncbi:DUF808 domain-containing protein [Limoniibacter endophyticus]|uniref:DUF808 domain-containing protein n=1 Tax=Limoniibacter endophyticus TaxID=1565040 RepID=A0A8J3DKQ8_9HYPH|nr:DUF808 domain-containing protein [Limoniibacter endophyticus]GHC77827.1 hypothetical protein GCM10010136_29310 [Limoniibacter endophyticus]